MKLKIDLTLTQNDTQSLKGEELDNEIESQIEDMQLDGWEVAKVDIARMKDTNIDAERKEIIGRLFDALFAEIESPDSPSKINPKMFTKRGIYEQWKSDLMTKLLR